MAEKADQSFFILRHHCCPLQEGFHSTACFQLRLRVPEGTASGIYNFTIIARDTAGTVYGQQAVSIQVVAALPSTIKSGGGMDVEYIRPYRINENHGHCYYVYPARFVIGTLETDGLLAQGVYHTLILVQNNTPEKAIITIKVSVPHAYGNPPVVTKGVTVSIDPFEAIQISGDKIYQLLRKTPYFEAPFLSGSVLIASKYPNLAVSAAYTFYQVSELNGPG